MADLVEIRLGVSRQPNLECHLPFVVRRTRATSSLRWRPSSTTSHVVASSPCLVTGAQATRDELSLDTASLDACANERLQAAPKRELVDSVAIYLINPVIGATCCTQRPPLTMSIEANSGETWFFTKSCFE